MKKLFQKISDPRTRQTLKYAIMDGVLWSSMFGMAEDYLIPFALHFRASPFQISLITAGGQLGISMVQFLGARFIENYRKRKILIIVCNQLHAFSWIAILVLTALTHNPLFIILFYFTGTTSANFGAPAWLSWMNDLVPAGFRGEYWGVRNRAMGFFQFLATCSAGLILYFFRHALRMELAGFAVLFGLAALFRSLSAVPLSRMAEPAMTVPPDEKKLTVIKFLKDPGHANFRKFVLFSCLMTFSVFFLPTMLSIHILKTLHYNYLFYAVIIMTSSVSSFLSMAYWGPLIDRFGNYALMRLCSVCIVLPALLWAFTRSLIFIIPLQVFAGFVWAGFNLTTFNFIFDSVKKEDVAPATAITSSLNSLMAFLGTFSAGVISRYAPLFAGLKFSPLNLEIIFLLSFLLRGATVLFLLRSFREVKKTAPLPPVIYLLAYFPARNIISEISVIGRRIRKAMPF